MNMNPTFKTKRQVFPAKEAKMGKFFSFLYRVVLVGNVLIALTPCVLCQGSMNSSSAKMEGCPMHHSGGAANCCHPAKSQNAFCKAMSQSAVPAVHAPDVSVSSLVSFVLSPYETELSPVSIFAFASDVSPPGILVLRI